MQQAVTKEGVSIQCTAGPVTVWHVKHSATLTIFRAILCVESDVKLNVPTVSHTFITAVN